MSEKATDDKVIGFLNQVICHAARALAVIMTLLILWGVADVVYVLYQRLINPSNPFMLLEIRDILATFGASWRY